MELTGAKIIIQTLLDLGVKTVFGYPGGAVLYIYDEIYKEKKLKHILARHEQGAVHAADGYSRVSGEVGVAIVTSGPGATNAVTGLATAYMDSIPMVCITGQVPVPLIGNDAFQEADIVGITRSCTKHNYLVRDVKDLARVLREAFHIASTGRPGPVLVDVPKDVTTHMCEYVNRTAEAVRIRSYKPTIKGHIGQVKRAVSLMKKSKRPMIYTGGGVVLANAADELFRFTKLMNAPITNTLMGLGAFPASDGRFVGMLGMHGTYEANMAVSHSDLLIAIGARFDDRVTGKLEEFAPNAKIIHIDIDPTSISKNVHVDVPIVGDVKLVLEQLNKQVDSNNFQNNRPDLTEWWDQVEEWRKKDSLAYSQGDSVIEAQYVIQKLCELTDVNTVITTDVGQHQMWTAQFYNFEKTRRFVTSGGLGTMGFGLPAGMGAQVAEPHNKVVVISGDGSVQMNMQELTTCVQYKLPVITLIMNNGFLGMVRQWQEFFYNRRYAETDMTQQPDFVKLAEAHGAMGLRAKKPDEVVPVLKKALASDVPVLIDMHIRQESNVYPMVPAGAALNDMILL